MTPEIIFVHGAFCGGWAFDDFRGRLEAAGFSGAAPDLRGHGQNDDGGSVAGVSMSDYADDIAKLAARQPTPPILIGHSLGGLVAQLAAQRVPVSAMILLAPSAPWGISGVTMEEAVSAFGLYSLGPFWAQSVAPDRTLARLYSLDRMDPDDRGAVTARMTAESGRALFETLNWFLDPFMTTRVDASRISAPVLVLSGAADMIHPPATVRQTAERLGGEYRLFPNMSHWLIGETGWETVADACIDWLATQLNAPAGARSRL